MGKNRKAALTRPAKKLQAVRPFTFRGRVLAVDEEFQPDNDEQGSMLVTIGHATAVKRQYKNRAVRPSQQQVMSTAVETASASPTGNE